MSIRTIMGAALLMVMSFGCDSGARYDRLNVYKQAGDSFADAGPGGIVVPVGGVVMFKARAIADGARDFVGFEELELVPDQPDVANVRRSIRSDSWVVNGKRAGSGNILVMLDGEPVDSISIEVTE